MTNPPVKNKPLRFHPNLNPADVIQRGSFGGTYFGPHVRDRGHREFPRSWFMGLPRDAYTRSERRYDESLNAYKVRAGSSLATWRAAGWIHPDDPRGWFQWYCRYRMGRRHPDDDRQKKRWASFVARTRGRLFSMIREKHGRWTNDWHTASPKMAQSLLHWAYEPTKAHYTAWLRANGY